MSQQVERPAAAGRPEPDALQRFAREFRENRTAYVGTGVVALVVVVVILVVANMGEGAGEDHFSPVWSAYADAAARITENRAADDELAALDAAAETARGTRAEGTALWLSALAHYGAAFTKDKLSFEDRKPHLEMAQKRLAELQGEKFDHFPPAVSRWFVATDPEPVKGLARQLEKDLAWARDHTYVEPQPDASPTAVIRTDEGDIHLRFYGDLAPGHVANFVANARRGLYNGTAFHFATGGEEKTSVAGGDPYSYFYNDPREKSHILRWGHGTTGYNVPPETSRFRVIHRRGTVTAQRRERADWDNGAQFRILLDSMPSLDRTYSPFARVVEGIGVVEKAANRPTVSTHPTYKDDPAFQSLQTEGLIVQPVWIEKVIVYDENGKALDHSFPLEPGEKSLAAVGETPLKPLQGEALRAGRKLVDPRGMDEYRRGLDIPFPSDIADPSKAEAMGERRADDDGGTDDEGTKKEEGDGEREDDGGDGGEDGGEEEPE